MNKEDEAFAEAFGDGAKPREQEPPKVQETPPKEEAPPKQAEPITAQEPAKVETPLSQEPPKEAERPRVDPDQFKGYLDEREKRQAAEQRLKDLERQLAQQQQQQTKEPPPDIYENPEGYRQHLETTYERRLMKLKVDQSEFFATRDFGAELVGEVKEWALRLDDARANHLLAQASPFHAAVEMFRQEKASATLKEYDYDLEKMKAKWLADLQAQPPVPGQPAQSPTAQPALNLPPKIAGTGGSLGKAPTPSEDAIFRSVFQR